MDYAVFGSDDIMYAIGFSHSLLSLSLYFLPFGCCVVVIITIHISHTNAIHLRLIHKCLEKITIQADGNIATLIDQNKPNDILRDDSIVEKVLVITTFDRQRHSSKGVGSRKREITAH